MKNSLHDFDKKISKFMELLGENKEELVASATKCTRTPLKNHIKDYKYAMNFLSKISKSKITKNVLKGCRLRPKGKILITLPSNEPFILSIIPITYALMAGNTVFINPSKRNIPFVRKIKKYMLKSSIGSHRFNLIKIQKGKLSNYLKKSEFNAVYWFGSSLTANKIAPLINAPFTEFIPEAEGNDLCYVDDKIDNLPEVVRVLIKSLTTHNGQVCNAVKGVFVHEKLWNNFNRELRVQFSKIKRGYSCDPNSDFAIDCNLMSKEFVRKYIQDLSNKHTQIVFLNEKYSAPAIIIEPNLNSEEIKKNISTSIMWVVKIKSVNSVVQLIQKFKHGIGFTIFSQNSKNIKKLMDVLDVARININRNPLDISPFEPWGGTKLSGNGGAEYWLRKFSNQQYIKWGKK